MMVVTISSSNHHNITIIGINVIPPKDHHSPIHPLIMYPPTKVLLLLLLMDHIHSQLQLPQEAPIITRCHHYQQLSDHLHHLQQPLVLLAAAALVVVVHHCNPLIPCHNRTPI